MTNQFRYLFSPIQIGPLQVRNRMVITAHLKNFTENCAPSERDAFYYKERARGGVGLIVTEATAVHPSSLGKRNYPIAYDSSVIPAYARAAAAVHEHGAFLIAQLHHSGHLTDGSPDGWGAAWAPSPVASSLYRTSPKTMGATEIETVVRGFELSAGNMQEAGMDGVEIHVANGYLLHQFFSPATNKRSDEYGGNVENRLRLTLQIVESVRAACGPDFVIGVRIVGDEFIVGGSGLAEAQEAAVLLESCGHVDYISVTGGATPTAYMVIGPMNLPQGYLVHLAAGVKQATNDIPVFTAGRIVDPLHAERILAEGQADMVAMTRANICDPEIANKAREGRLEDIRTCVGCNQGCRARYQQQRPITCVQNPAAGREKTLGYGTVVPAVSRKHVVVVGGGPAGMEAARMLATRGLRVTLFEGKNELGGQVNLAARAPGREEFGGIARYLSGQIAKLGVAIHLGTRVDAGTIAQLKPDATVIATGSRPSFTVSSPYRQYRSEIPGADQENVISIEQLFQGDADIGDRVIVIDEDGHQRTASAVDYLSSHGKSVEVLTPFPFFGFDVVLTHDQPLLLQRIGGRGVALRPYTAVKEIRGDAVIAHETFSRREQIFEGFDTIVLAIGSKAEDGLYQELLDKTNTVYAIGDCVAPRGVAHAIYEGNLVGREV